MIDYFFQHPSLLKDPNLKARFKKAYKRERKARENAGVHVKTTPSLKKPVGDRAYVPPRVQESSESEEEVSLVRDSRQDGPPASSFRQLDKETVSGTGNKKKRPKPKPKTSSQTANTNQPQPSTSKHPPAQSPKKKVIVPDSADESSEASFQRLPATGPSKKNGKAPHRPFKQPSRPSQSDKGKSRQLDSVPLSAPAPQPEPTISREMSPVNGFDRIGGADFSFQDDWMPSSGIPSPPQTEAAQPSIKLPNFSRNVVVPDSEEEEDLDMLNLAPPAHKSQPQPPQPAASSPPMEMEGSMHSDRALSPDLDFYSALDQHEPQATARQPPRSASPLIRPAISPRKRSNLFRHSPDEDEHSTEHTLKDPRPAKRGKPNDDPPSAPAPTQSPPARAPSPPDLFSRAPSPRESIRSPGSPDRQLSPVATPHQESEEEYDALFDEPRRYTNKFFSGSNTNVFGGERPTSKWELSQRTADFKFMEEQVAGYHHMQVVMPPGWRKGQSVETHEHVDAYWSIDANYGPAKHLNGKSRVEELIAGRTAVIFAPKWVEQSKQNTTTTQDVTALQLLLLRRGASDVCGLSKLRQASMIFIHVSELQTVSDLETLVDNKVFNEMRRTRPDVEFAIFGTRSSKQRSASRLSPVFKRIWHIGSAVTFTSKSIMDRASTFGNLVSTGASWSPILKFWLHGNCRILGDRQFQKDHSEYVATFCILNVNLNFVTAPSLPFDLQSPIE